jgi:hypothetical protein
VIPDYEALIGALTDAHADFVIVGAVAMVLHGSPRVTRDLDICYARDAANLKALAAALAPFRPTLRGAPPDLPFKLDARTLQSGLNFTLSSSAGDIDLLGEISGLGGFAVVRRLSVPMTIYGRAVHVLSLDGLERAKRAAGRLKDVADLAEILELRKRQSEE